MSAQSNPTKRFTGDSAPVIILGPHRSGTSALAGALSKAGLELGEVIGPGPDNPKGYFENHAILNAHMGLLNDIQRDWLCPPDHLDPDRCDLEPLTRAISDLATLAGDRRWGVKDPRVLYTLPIWCALVSHVTLVGVFRRPEAIAASMTKRNDIEPEQARAFADRQLARLLALREQHLFPILEFGHDTDEFLESVRLLTKGLGLDSDAIPADFLDAGLVHHRGEQGASLDDKDPIAGNDPVDDKDPVHGDPIHGDPVVGRLRELARTAGGDTAGLDNPLDTSALAASLGPMADPSLNGPYWSGPAHQERLRLCRLHAAEYDLAETRQRIVSPATPLTDSPELRAEPPSHVLGPGLLEEFGLHALRRVLRTADSARTPNQIAVFDGFVVDDLPMPAVVDWPRSATRTRRGSAPFHLHVDELRAVAVDTGWRLATVAPINGPGSRCLITYVKDGQLRREQRTQTEWQQIHAELEAQVAALNSDVAHRDNLLSESRGRLVTLASELATERRRAQPGTASIEQVWLGRYEKLLDDNRGLRHWAAESVEKNRALNAELGRLRTDRDDLVRLHQTSLLSPRQAAVIKRVLPAPLVPLIRRLRARRRERSQ